MYEYLCPPTVYTLTYYSNVRFLGGFSSRPELEEILRKWNTSFLSVSREELVFWFCLLAATHYAANATDLSRSVGISAGSIAQGSSFCFSNQNVLYHRTFYQPNSILFCSQKYDFFFLSNPTKYDEFFVLFWN